MKDPVVRQRLVRELSLIALLVACVWNFVLVVSAAVGASWVLPRVAGGQLTEMPLSLRVAYGLFALVSVGVAWLGWYMWRAGGAHSIRIRRYSIGVIVIYSVSTVINAASVSTSERWNAVAAFAVVVGTWVLRQKVRNEEVSF